MVDVESASVSAIASIAKMYMCVPTTFTPSERFFFYSWINSNEA